MRKDDHLIFESYTLNGLAKGKSVEELAKKHGVQVQDIEAQIDKGVQVEKEHTSDEQTARKIAMDHVFENPKYYDNLSKIETKSKDSVSQKIGSEDNEMPEKDFSRDGRRLGGGDEAGNLGGWPSVQLKLLFVPPRREILR